MIEVFALMRGDAPLLYARRRGQQWQVSERQPDVGSRGNKLCVFVTGEQVLSLQAPVPARNEAEARRAAPFIVEDELAEPTDNIHVALGPRGENLSEPRTIQAVNASQMQNWVSRLGELGLSQASLAAAHDILPQTAILCLAGEQVLGRLNGRSFTLDRAIGTDVLLGMLANGETPEIRGDELAQALQLEASGPGLDSDEGLLVQLAEWASDGTWVNLRQGSFRTRASLSPQDLGQWRIVGALAACAALAWLGVTWMQTSAMQSRAEVLDKRAVEFAEAGWPGAGGDVNAVLAQRASTGAGTRGLPSVLVASAVLYDGLSRVPGAQLRSLRYDAGRGDMSVVVVFDGFEGAANLAREIEAAGLMVRTGDARQNGGKVVSELTMGASQ